MNEWFAKGPNRQNDGFFKTISELLLNSQRRKLLMQPAVEGGMAHQLRALTEDPGLASST